jgi:hypothetical protein
MTPLPRLNLTSLQPAVQAALRAWYDLEAGPETRLEQLLLMRERQAALGGDSSPSALRRATNEVLLAGLEELKQGDSRGDQVLRSRYLELLTGKEAASRLNLNRDHVNRLQREALSRLTKILLHHEQAAREARIQRLEEALPASQSHQLFGVEPLEHKLEQILLTPDAPWLVMVSGLGGIGKTALADAVARRLIRRFHFERLHWLRTAPGKGDSPAMTFEALVLALAESLWPGSLEAVSPTSQAARVRYALKAQPHLVVIDNLETEAETACVLENLNGFAAPSKFLLTTRARLAGASLGAFVLSLDELGLVDAAALLRHHAALIGQSELGALLPEEAEAVYKVVGGNPLALKLVVSLAAVLPLAHLLKDLEQAHTGKVEEMYRHIYWRAWHSLGEAARALLQAMPLVADVGALPEQLLAISGLAEAQLWPAIAELWSRSLLEARGSLHQKRYGLHRLTETFLRTEIIHWPEAV